MHLYADEDFPYPVVEDAEGPPGKLLPIAFPEKNSDLPKNFTRACFIILDGICGP